MLCYRCLKQDVCVLKDHCEQLEKLYNNILIDGSFKFEIDCLHRKPGSIEDINDIMNNMRDGKII